MNNFPAEDRADLCGTGRGVAGSSTDRQQCLWTNQQAFSV
jgi:hypothetical protein